MSLLPDTENIVHMFNVFASKKTKSDWGVFRCKLPIRSFANIRCSWSKQSFVFGSNIRRDLDCIVHMNWIKNKFYDSVRYCELTKVQYSFVSDFNHLLFTIYVMGLNLFRIYWRVVFFVLGYESQSRLLRITISSSNTVNLTIKQF